LHVAIVTLFSDLAILPLGMVNHKIKTPKGVTA